MTKPITPKELAYDNYGPLYAARKKVYPQSVSGKFRRIKWALMAFCLGVYYFLPFVRWNRDFGTPDQAVLIDFPNRRFYFFFIVVAAGGLLLHRPIDSGGRGPVPDERDRRPHLVRLSLPANGLDRSVLRGRALLRG